MPEEYSCREKILSEEYQDYIIGRIGTFWDEIINSESCMIPLKYFYRILYANRDEVGGRELYQIPYPSVPKCFTLLDTEVLQQTGIAQVQTIPGLELYGENVIIGFIDTGINYKQSIFRKLDGSTRIAGIWDQSLQTGTPPMDFAYGSEYTREDINEALRNENPEQLVPTRDENGHGTFVASIACGNGIPEEEFAGVAPEAEIAVVKLKGAKQYLRDYYSIAENVVCYQENDIMTALTYLDQLAQREGKSLIVCMALGTSMGGHDGDLPLSGYLELMGGMPRRALVTGTGNEADKRHHYMQNINNEGRRVEFNVGREVKGFVMELWTELPNIFTVTITSPSGETSLPIPLREGSGNYEFLFEETRIFVNYRILVEGTSAQVVFIKLEEPAEGIWRLNITPVFVGDGEYHIWLPMSEFLTGEVFFLESNPDYTITGPGNVRSVACTAYYDGDNNSLAVSSGRGYTRTNQIKPDFAAPGVNVLGANLRGQLVRRSGSSIAVAVVAGAEALLMEWADQRGETPDSLQIKNLLILGAERERTQTYPNRGWGYGRLNLYQTFENIRQI